MTETAAPEKPLTPIESARQRVDNAIAAIRVGTEDLVLSGSAAAATILTWIGGGELFAQYIAQTASGTDASVALLASLTLRTIAVGAAGVAVWGAVEGFSARAGGKAALDSANSELVARIAAGGGDKAPYQPLSQKR